LLFTRLEPASKRKVVNEMYERNVSAGEILIKEGDTGIGASELYVVKSGKFEVCHGLAYLSATSLAHCTIFWQRSSML
jgi:CRP-like cAMP-binding protein